jgi:hypothetical protein
MCNSGSSTVSKIYYYRVRRILEDDHAALIAAFWTHINDPVCVANHIEMVLNHDHRVSTIYDPVHDGEPQRLSSEAGSFNLIAPA